MHHAEVHEGLNARTVALAGATAVTAVAVTLGSAHWQLRWVSGDGYGQVALDSVAATVGLLLAFLVHGRFLQSRLRRDALLCAALLVLAGGNALLSVLPLVVGDTPRLTTASALAGLAAGVLFASAVWSHPREVPGRLGLPAVAGAAAVVLALSWMASRLLPRTGPGSADTFGTGSDLLLTACQVLAAAAFLGAAAGWCRSSVQDDGIARWLAVAAVFAGVSRLDFAVAAEPGSSYVTAATLLRLAFYATLVGASVVQILGYWRSVRQVAVLEERRRIARDLHDGLAQELAFIATQARALADRSEHPTRARLVSGAAERALDESRRAIAALTRPLDEPLDVALAQCAEEVCSRYDASLLLDVDADLQASADTREALLRIVREAVSNALRHGRARSVTVRLHGPAPLHLEVADDGSGFDPADLRHLSGRFGLVSMRERAEALGGTFAVSGRPAGGTAVEVRLP